jgi:hypothetical protein
VVRDACPAASRTPEPSGVVPVMVNATLPVGVPEADVTVAVNVTL